MSDSIEALREALRHSPDNLPLLLHLAQTLASSGRLDEAEEAYDAGRQRHGEEPRLLCGLADVYLRSGRLSHAIVMLEALVARDDAPAAAHGLLAKAAAAEDRTRDAQAHYRRAQEVDPAYRDPAIESSLEDRAASDTDLDFEDDDEDDFVGGRERARAGEAPGSFEPETEKPTIGFDAVGGMDAVKEQLRVKIIHPLANPELYKAYGKKVGGGVMLYGPPGCGKTHLARAAAGEIDATFISVGLHEVMDMWIGQSERNLHDVFDAARRRAPCVLFFDEVDAIGARRTDMRQSASRTTINQFLAELDGVETDNDGVLVLAATNAPWHVDPAFRRPGRFDEIIFVPPPDEAARATILAIHLRGKPAEQVDVHQVAARTRGFSGADLKAVVDRAVEAKLAQAMKHGVPVPIRTKDLLAAAKKSRPSTREWFATAKNYATFSNPDGAYDDVVAYLKESR